MHRTNAKSSLRNTPTYNSKYLKVFGESTNREARTGVRDPLRVPTKSLKNDTRQVYLTFPVHSQEIPL